MSNGARSCPTVTLPFGVFAGTNTIDPLDPTQFPAADPAPGLEQYIIDNAPTDASPLDGFDTAFAETVGFVDALDAALGALAGELLLAFAEADTIDPAPVGDTVAGFTSSLDVSSTAVDDLGTLLAGSTTPAPVGGGGAAAPCGTLDFGPGPASGPTGTQFRTHTVYLQNNDPTPLTILSTSWDPPIGYTFEILPDVAGAIVQPGQLQPITIVVGSGSLGTYTSTLTVHTDGPDPQPCLTVTATFVQGSGPHPPNPRCPTGDVVFDGKHAKVHAFCA